MQKTKNKQKKNNQKNPKPKIQNWQKKFMQQIFLKKDTQVNLLKILKTLSPALFLDKGKGETRKYSLEFEGQLNWKQE